jgi:hypothetical protein
LVGLLRKEKKKNKKKEYEEKRYLFRIMKQKRWVHIYVLYANIYTHIDTRIEVGLNALENTT